MIDVVDPLCRLQIDGWPFRDNIWTRTCEGGDTSSSWYSDRYLRAHSDSLVVHEGVIDGVETIAFLPAFPQLTHVLTVRMSAQSTATLTHIHSACASQKIPKGKISRARIGDMAADEHYERDRTAREATARVVGNGAETGLSDRRVDRNRQLISLCLPVLAPEVPKLPCSFKNPCPSNSDDHSIPLVGVCIVHGGHLHVFSFGMQECITSTS